MGQFDFLTGHTDPKLVVGFGPACTKACTDSVGTFSNLVCKYKSVTTVLKVFLLEHIPVVCA